MSNSDQKGSSYSLPTAFSTAVGIGVGTYVFNKIEQPQLKLAGGLAGLLISGFASFRLVEHLDEDDENSLSEKDISILRAKLIQLYRETPCMPIMVRLAWHDAGTYDAATGTGGPNGTIRFDPEASHGANAGLRWAMNTLEAIKSAAPACLSYADLYQLASVVAIEFCGGPSIPFRPGRKDLAASMCTPDGRLPAADKGHNHLRDIFYRMGFVDREIVALSGAHTLGAAHADRSGFNGPWTQEPLIFDNSYFQELLEKDANPNLLRLPSDMALLNEPGMKRWVEAYADDEQLFFADYVKAHQKLSELGVKFG
uniref:Plant heme peroxidase family profile domain-containing protein n=1 Tax=Fibrocapsa japonica TaxID=94617 RepID=A0A7S2UYN3_9STRA|mmetsp:Transcript_20614/g.29832  ORF Transcript_20614/g.29832 Transcript_20614/m.29832 type:complete len:312 (+) Transcript_20614:58-993(+)|eukprot:CAMPEP_0113941190 /NCGR_PEP_ID=MMETSP1339-20121228/7162_1 /TAXON_ID=94617 /ORGANISM="Fibrocapsa japonica" /LENGTH=311 /DNA_ID=CAMNT_0000945269 /DNA_START=58 /DNA_END=993 /DNA_ORIENTATION=- /assembly_acc=CAM_ASM_000762